MTGPLVRLSAWRARRRARLNAKVTRTERPDGGIGAEALIRTASEDRLRRTDFADRIAGVLSELSLREGRGVLKSSPTVSSLLNARALRPSGALSEIGKRIRPNAGQSRSLSMAVSITHVYDARPSAFAFR